MVDIQLANEANITKAARLIKAGELVAFGTETVYGLGGNATDDSAIKKIYTIKDRPSFNPLISHVPDIDSADLLGTMTPLATTLAAAFWPGPMTLVLDKTKNCPVSPLATAGLETIALRIPACPVAQAFLKAAGVPVAAPSANRSGRISPTRASHVMSELGDKTELAMILDSGATQDGLESTVIDARGDGAIILRHGSITADMIAEKRIATTALPEAKIISPIISPGQMASHYAPKHPVMLNQHEAGENHAWIGFGKHQPRDCHTAFNLSEISDLVEAASNLYHMLRQADASGAQAIAIAPIPDTGIGVAINDRLARAAQMSKNMTSENKASKNMASENMANENKASKKEQR